MNTRKIILLVASLGIGFFLLLDSVFIVSQIQQSIILQFGEMLKTIKEPGLKWKLPYIQNVVSYDNRMLDFDSPDTEVTLGDQKRIIVNIFTRYRIVDPLQFYKTVRSESGVRSRLSPLITGTMRSILGYTKLSELLSANRALIMLKIREQVSESTKNLGIDVVEVRIKRADLPKENSEAIFQRMISERHAEAEQIRSQGKEIAEVIRANTDRECTIINAKARKEAQILMGQAEAEVEKLYREAYGRSPKFGLFYRTLEAYKVSLSGEQNFYVLSPKHDFLKLFSQYKIDHHK